MSKNTDPHKNLRKKRVTEVSDDELRAVFADMRTKAIREGIAKCREELKTYNGNKTKQEKKRKMYWALKNMVKLANEELNNRPLDSFMSEIFPKQLRNE